MVSTCIIRKKILWICIYGWLFAIDSNVQIVKEQDSSASTVALLNCSDGHVTIEALDSIPSAEKKTHMRIKPQAPAAPAVRHHQQAEPCCRHRVLLQVQNEQVWRARLRLGALLSVQRLQHSAAATQATLSARQQSWTTTTPATSNRATRRSGDQYRRELLAAELHSPTLIGSVYLYSYILLSYLFQKILSILSTIISLRSIKSEKEFSFKILFDYDPKWNTKTVINKLVYLLLTDEFEIFIFIFSLDFMTQCSVNVTVVVDNEIE